MSNTGKVTTGVDAFARMAWLNGSKDKVIRIDPGRWNVHT